MRSVQMRRLLFLVAIANVAAVFYSDWADNKCPATFPPYSTGCSWSTSCNSAGVCTTKHRHTCKSKDSAVHYCGDECNELCTSLQGGGAAADVCATDASGNPGGCVHGTCKAEGSPTSAHCYCAAGWTGVHCSVPATPSTPSPASPTPSPATSPATPPATSPTPAPAPAPTPAPAPAPSPAPTGSGYCQTNEHNSTTFTQNCNNGACTEASSTFTCTCNSGWSGIYCLTSSSTAQPAAGTWQRNVLDRHNTLRANIYSATNGAQPSAGSLYQLVWDYNLEQHAQKYASSNKVFTCSALVHSAQATRQSKAPYSNVGENLFAAGTSGSFDPVSAVNSWFNEYSDYTLSSNTCASGKMCGHYTQVVWKNTYAVGCGLQKVICGSMTWYVVACQYGEAGNFVGVAPYAAASDLQTTVVKTYPTAL